MRISQAAALSEVSVCGLFQQECEISEFKCVRVRGESVQLPEGRANSWRFQTCLNFLGSHVLQCKHSYAPLITQNTSSYSQRLSKTIIMGELRQICLKMTPN